MNVCIGILLLGSLLPMAAAQGQTYNYKVDGNELYKDCGVPVQLDRDRSRHLTDEDRENGMYCLGYVAGAVDALVGVNMACIPAGTTRGAELQIVWNFLDTHPQRRHEYAIALIVVAMLQQYPCKAK